MYDYWLITLADGSQAHIQYMVPASGMRTQDKHRTKKLVWDEVCRMLRLDRRNA